MAPGKISLTRLKLALLNTFLYLSSTESYWSPNLLPAGIIFIVSCWQGAWFYCFPQWVETLGHISTQQFFAMAGPPDTGSSCAYLVPACGTQACYSHWPKHFWSSLPIFDNKNCLPRRDDAHIDLQFWACLLLSCMKYEGVAFLAWKPPEIRNRNFNYFWCKEHPRDRNPLLSSALQWLMKRKSNTSRCVRRLFAAAWVCSAN